MIGAAAGYSEPLHRFVKLAFDHVHTVSEMECRFQKTPLNGAERRGMPHHEGKSRTPHADIGLTIREFGLGVDEIREPEKIDPAVEERPDMTVGEDDRPTGLGYHAFDALVRDRCIRRIGEDDAESALGKVRAEKTVAGRTYTFERGIPTTGPGPPSSRQDFLRRASRTAERSSTTGVRDDFFRFRYRSEHLSPQ